MDLTPQAVQRAVAAALALTLTGGIATAALRERSPSTQEQAAQEQATQETDPDSDPGSDDDTGSSTGDDTDTDTGTGTGGDTDTGTGTGGGGTDSDTGSDEVDSSGARLPQDLELRIGAPPPPAERLTDASQGLGGLDADRLLALSGGSAETRADAARGLDLLGFRYAVGHAWTVPEGVYVVIVYRFDDPEGAEGLVAGLRSNLPGKAFSTPTVTRAVTYSTRSKDYSEQHGSFAYGRYVYEVDLLSRKELPDGKRFDQLITAQRDHVLRVAREG